MSGPALAPMGGTERAAEIDIVRGFALFGVLWVNLHAHSYLAIAPETLAALPTAPVDRIVEFFTRWLASGKAQALFSILFGFGFAMMMDRAEEKGLDGVRPYIRRLALLGIIGLLHLFLIWTGDILHAYAAMGFLLLVTRRWPGWLLLLTGLLLAIFFQAAVIVTENMLTTAADRSNWADIQHAGILRRAMIFQGSDYAAYVAELVRASWTEFYHHFVALAFLGWIFGRFLIGVWLCRRKWVQDCAQWQPQYRSYAPMLLATGPLLSLISPAMRFAGIATPEPLRPVFWVLGPGAQLALALGYGASIILLCQKEVWRRRLAGLGVVGRMALTNYLMQSLVYFFILYGFGLGLLPYAGATFCLILAICVFALQIAFSRWWLARYRFGPAEWAWRSATYGRRQPMRIAPPVAALA